jgi:hypothetical protein
MGKKKTYEYIKNYFHEKGFILLSNEYITSGDKLDIKDEDGYLYSYSYEQVMYAMPSKFFNNNPYTERNIKLWIQINKRPFYLVDGQEFVNDRQKLLFKCLLCPEDEIPFSADWSHIIRESGCAICHGKQVGRYNNFQHHFPKISEEWDYTKNIINPSDVTAFSRKKVWWKCFHGTEFFEGVCDRADGKSGCKICSREKWINSKRNNVMESGKDITITNPEIIKDWDYKKNNFPPNAYTHGANEIISWKCSICGLSWDSPISRRTGYYKSGCPSCASSKGESRIRDFLTSNSIKYIKEKTFSDCKWKINGSLRFDFYIQERNLIIEHDGIQHFEPIRFGGISQKEAIDNFKSQKKKDKAKNVYCYKNNITLIRIPYWNYDNIEEILSNYLNL